MSKVVKVPATQQEITVATNNATERVDISKLGYIEQVRLLKELNEAIATKRADELKTICNGFQMKVIASDFTIQEAIAELRTYLPAEATPAPAVKRTRSPKGSAAPKEYVDMDSTGARPEIGAWYRLPSGIIWQKKSKIGATNKNFVEAIHDEVKPTTWAALKADYEANAAKTAA